MSARQYMQTIPVMRDGVLGIESVRAAKIDDIWCVHRDPFNVDCIKLTHRETGRVLGTFERVGLERFADIAHEANPPQVKIRVPGPSSRHAWKALTAWLRRIGKALGQVESDGARYWMRP